MPSLCQPMDAHTTPAPLHLGLHFEALCHAVRCFKGRWVVPAKCLFFASQGTRKQLECLFMSPFLIEDQCHVSNSVECGCVVLSQFLLVASQCTLKPLYSYRLCQLKIDATLFTAMRVVGWCFPSACSLSVNARSYHSSASAKCRSIPKPNTILWTVSGMDAWFFPRAFSLPANTRSPHSSTSSNHPVYHRWLLYVVGCGKRRSVVLSKCLLKASQYTLKPHQCLFIIPLGFHNHSNAIHRSIYRIVPLPIFHRIKLVTYLLQLLRLM